MELNLRRLFQMLPLLAFLFVSGLVAPAQSGPHNRIAKAITNDSMSSIGGTVHPMARPENDQGLMDSSTILHGVTIVFAPSAAQQASLDALVKRQQDPASPDYRRWLTAQQFADRFGMTRQDIAKVSAWLASQGFTVDSVAESRNSIRFSGTVATVERALNTQIHKYSLERETHFANASEISLPSAFSATVVGVRGLNDFKLRPRIIHTPHAKVSLTTPQFTSGSSGEHFLAPTDVAIIYDINPLYTAGYTGSGQTIGVMGQTDIVMADITAFRTAAGLPANNPTVFLIPGSADPGLLETDVNEADLDLEWSGGVAKNANIVFVNSANVLDSLQYAIENKINGVQIPILSISYGDCEPNFPAADLTTFESLLLQASAQGQTVLASSGDTGAADCDFQTSSSTAAIISATHGLQVDYPASSAYVTGLGGSEFTGDGTAAAPLKVADQYWSANGSTDVLTSALSYIPEMAWNDTAFQIANGGGLSAGGGGASTLWPKPSWQTGVPGIPSDSHRDLPDVSLNSSADHDGYLLCTQFQPTANAAYTSNCTNGFRYSDQTLQAVGGTSVATPTFAGILALIEQKLGAPQGLGNINPTLYGQASNPATYASAFHDITAGDNIVPCTAGTTNCPGSGALGYSAGTGYDQATGLGSVDASNLATAFTTIAVKGGTTTTLAITPSTLVTGATVTLTATVTANSAAATPAAPTGTMTFIIDGTAGIPVNLTNDVATSTTSFSTGGPHTITASYSGDTSYYDSHATTNLTVAASGKAATTTTLAANPTTVALNGALTLTATVQSSAAGTVTGLVTFTIGNATLTTIPVIAGANGTGTATLALNSAALALGFVAGGNTITAQYWGDLTYAGSSSTATVTVTNPGITMTVANMTIPSASPGNSGTSTITVTSTGGYSGTINLTATAPTLNASAGFGATSLAILSGGSASTTITIQTIAAALKKTQSASRGTTGRMMAGTGAALCGVFLLGIPGFRKRRWPMLTSLLLLGALSTALGCGGGSSSSSRGASPVGTYTVTVTATDSSNSAITTSANFTVTVN